MSDGWRVRPIARLFAAAGVVLPPNTPYIWRDYKGQCVGGFAYTGHGADMVQMHYVGIYKRWMTRELLRRGFTYPFQTLGVRAILAYLPPEHTYARDVAIKLGFRKFGVIPGVGIHMLTMVREDCRWLDLPSRGVNG